MFNYAEKLETKTKLDHLRNSWNYITLSYLRICNKFSVFSSLAIAGLCERENIVLQWTTVGLVGNAYTSMSEIRR